MTPVAFLVLGMTLALHTTARAGQAPLQRGVSCAAAWDAGRATVRPGARSRRPWTLVCEDGDRYCDVDGQQDGACAIPIRACVLPGTEACASTLVVRRLRIPRTDRKRLPGLTIPDLPAAAPACGRPGLLDLHLRGPRRNRPSRVATLSLTARTPRGKGSGALRVRCVPRTVCDAFCDDLGADRPRYLTLTMLPEGSDLDVGHTGALHDSPVPFGGQLRYCLADCDFSSDSTCTASGSTGASGGCALNGPTLGTPLPLENAAAPVCIVNRFQSDMITGTFDVASGAFSSLVELFTDVYRTSYPETCPRCVTADTVPGIGSRGRCSATSRNPGDSCEVQSVLWRPLAAEEETGGYSSDCLPDGEPIATLDIRLPLTTGVAALAPGARPCPAQTSDDACGEGATCVPSCSGQTCIARNADGACLDAKGGIAQACCSDVPERSCFPTRGGEPVHREGVPAGPNPTATLAATLCVPSTGDTVIDLVAGLPGPAALLLPVTVSLLPEKP